MLSPYAESWEIIELLSRTSRENWSSWNGWKEESWWKKSTILLDNLKRMAIFALFSYELGRQVKASIFSLKGMLAFLLSHTEGVLQQGRNIITLTVRHSHYRSRKYLSSDMRMAKTRCFKNITTLWTRNTIQPPKLLLVWGIVNTKICIILRNMCHSVMTLTAVPGRESLHLSFLVWGKE